MKELAESLGYKQSNFSNKLREDNFSEKELIRIAEALNCKYDSIFTMKDTGEKI
ncbi:MAG: transcriptional regulator [Clostridiales bacterium]|nr:transcriptional regulator [Clostridiales bacterium]